MKKRSMSLLLVLVMVFSLLPISAMAQVYVVTENTESRLVQFKKGDTPIENEPQRLVKQTADEQLAAGAIYDPGCTLGDNEVFLGWSYVDADGNTVKTKTVGDKTEYLTVDDILAYVNAHWSDLNEDITANNKTEKGLIVTAYTSEVRYIVYHDENGRVLKTQDVVKEENGGNWNTKIDLDYAPSNTNSEFYGWTETKGNLEPDYADGQNIELTKQELNLYPAVKTGHWVTFVENDKPYNSETHVGNPDLNQDIHASYLPPLFVVEGETKAIGNGTDYTVSAPGYVFEGWVDAAGNPVNSVSGEATVYAKWAPQDNVEYKVAYWQQNANDDEYSLVIEDIETRTGRAGDPANYNTSQSYEGFHLNPTKTNEAATVIAGDGSTIRNVYFDREEYEIHFMQVGYVTDPNGSYVKVDVPFVLYDEGVVFGVGRQTLHFQPGYYLINDLKNYDYKHRGLGTPLTGYLDAYDDAIETDFWGSFKAFHYNTDESQNSAHDTSVRYSATWTENNAIKIRARYGADIFDKWPSNVNPNAYPNTWRVHTEDNSIVSSACPIMPLGGETYYDNVITGNYTMLDNYYLDDVNGRPTYSAKYSTAMSSNSNLWSLAGADDITGFTFDDSGSTAYVINKNGQNERVTFAKVHDRYSQVGNTNTYVMSLHYTRNSYPVSFFTNGGPAVSSSVPTSRLYEQSMADCNPTKYDADQYVIGETVEDIQGKPMVFLGWYDNDSFVGDAYDFNEETMPAKAVQLYAKWGDIKYRVILNAEGGQYGEGANAADSIQFKVDDRGTVGKNEPVRENYTFIDWYKADPDNMSNHYYERFNSDSLVTKDVLTEPDYTEQPEPGDNTVVHGKLTLYAKWRAAMETDEYIKVVYEPNGFAGNVAVSGTVSKQDGRKYADTAEAVAQPAAQPDDDSASFVEWEVLDASGNPTGVTVKPGGTFEVLKINATGPESVTDENNAEVTYHVYTLTLRAKYSLVETTHLTYVGNGGKTEAGATYFTSDTVTMNSTQNIEPDTLFTREGYEFLGWARLPETGNKLDDAGTQWQQHTENDPSPLTEADVWLKWDDVNEKWIVQNDSVAANNGKDALGVAANQKTPFHVLYAVWQKIENYNYVIDFNAKMTVAEQTSELRNADANGVLQGDNGQFVKSGSNVTYQLTTGTQHTEANGTTVINTAYSVADSAVIYGKPVGEGTKTGWNKITTVPASSIYFDDDLANTTVTVGDGSGKNDQVSLTDANNLAQGKHTYTFYGTGIDVYCTTYDKMGEGENAEKVGTISAKLVKDGKTVYENMYNYSPVVRYNVPTVFFHDLPLGEYTLTLTAFGSSNYKLDGIRVYNAVADQTLYNETKNEQYAAYVNLRDALVNNPNIESVTIQEGMPQSNITQGTGILFVDNPELLNQQVEEVPLMVDGKPVVDENGQPKTTKAYTEPFTAYKDLGPKNEIYLSEGQSITFTLTDTAKAGKLWIGLSAPETGKTTGEVLVNNDTANKITVTSAMDMYYPITKNTTGSYTIKNNGTNLIAITNLKITGVESIYNVAAGQPTSQGNGGEGQDSNAGAVVESLREDVVNLVFEPVTMRTVMLAANNGVDPDAVVVPDDPGTPDEPDTPDTPDNPNPFDPMAMLKALFEQLMKNLFNLFSGLGNW